MIQIIIDTTTSADGEATFNWSVWSDDQQIESGRTPFFSARECEADAIDYCWRALGYKPDKVTRP